MRKLFIIFIILLSIFGLTNILISETIITKQEIRTILNECNEEYIDGYGNTYIIFNTDKAVDKIYNIIPKGE